MGSVVNLILLVVVIATTTPTKSAGIGSQSPDDCVNSIGFDNNRDRIPSHLKIINSCKPGCHEIRAAIAVGYKSNKTIHVLDMVIACQKRITCGDAKINIKLNVNARRRPTHLSNVICPSTTDELFMKIPVMVYPSSASGRMDLVYEKIVYGCRCNCTKNGNSGR